MERILMEFTFIPIAFLLSAIIALMVAVIAWRNRSVNEMPLLTLLLIFISVYAIASALEVASQGVHQMAGEVDPIRADVRLVRDDHNDLHSLDEQLASSPLAGSGSLQQHR